MSIFTGNVVPVVDQLTLSCSLAIEIALPQAFPEDHLKASGC